MRLTKIDCETVADIAAIESEFNIKLPDDYKAFLSESNGVNVSDGYIYVEALEQHIMMGVLYGVGTPNNSADIMRNNREYRDDVWINSILIGGDVCGGWILLVCDGENDGIWYYDHSYFFENSTDESNTYLIADSFSKFMNMMKEPRVG